MTDLNRPGPTSPGPAQPHYWSMEHYGFADHQPEPQITPAPAAAVRPTSPPRGLRTALGAAVAAAVLGLVGFGGFAAAQATDAQPQQSVVTQVDDAPVLITDGGRGLRGGGPRGDVVPDGRR